MVFDSEALFVPPIEEQSSAKLLFCFPYAGGSPFLFRDWRSRLLPDVQLTALQIPGHGARLTEPAYHSMDEVLDEIVQKFPALGDRGFAFYGHSLGAILAFESAQRLRGLGLREPCHLFVGAARPPHVGPMLPLLAELDDKEFLGAVQARYDGIPPEMLSNPGVLSMFLPALRADFAIYESYAYKPRDPLDCPISAFAGSADPHVPQELMTGWEEHTTADFSLRSLRGDHFFLEERRDELTGSILHKLSVSC